MTASMLVLMTASMWVKKKDPWLVYMSALTMVHLKILSRDEVTDVVMEWALVIAALMELRLLYSNTFLD
jgi:hypothetical protein